MSGKTGSVTCSVVPFFLPVRRFQGINGVDLADLTHGNPVPYFLF